VDSATAPVLGGFCQPVSSFSHLIAAGAALMAAVPLVRLGRGSYGRVFALSVYVSCVIAALAISGVYHSLAEGGRARLIMQRLDYFAIWMAMAGTFTAIHGLMCRGFWRGGLLCIIWGYAIVGVLLQLLWWQRFTGPTGLVLYLGLGWIGFLSAIKIGRQIGYKRVLPVVGAGIVFSTGAILEACSWPVLLPPWVGAHEVFHFAVIAGIATLWLFIRWLLVHQVPRQSAETVKSKSGA
jgi:channel protein (hemolysin III family)